MKEQMVEEKVLNKSKNGMGMLLLGLLLYLAAIGALTVSYTHLTLPTIYSV